MAKEPAAAAAPQKGKLGGPTSTVDASFARTNSTSIQMGEPGAKPTATTVKGGAQGMDFNADGKGGVKADETFDPDAEVGEGAEAGAAEEGAEEQDGGDEPPVGDLGAFKNDPETLAKFDAAYVSKDGSPNLEALSAEWMKNSKPGKPGTLNAATYDYLQATLGLTKPQVKEIEAGQAAKTQLLQNDIFTRAGGKANLDAALAWGKGGGYSKADQDRFNSAMATNDPNAVNDAVDLLVARYDKTKGPTPQGRRARNPERNVTTEAHREPVAAEGYPSREAWSKAFKEANNSKDPAQIAAVRAKLIASPWRKGQ